MSTTATTLRHARLSELRTTTAPAGQSHQAQRWLDAPAAPRPTLRDGGTTMETGPVRVRVLLLIGDQAEIVADVEGPAGPVRYPAQEIADAVGLAPAELPGRRLLATVGAGDRLAGWRLA